MQGKQAIYLGRSIATDGFRTFIYGSNGVKKLVKSWDEFEAHMASGIWFDTLEKAMPKKAEQTDSKDKLEARKKRGD